MTLSPSGSETQSPGGLLVWLTGLSGSGKTTLAQAIERECLHAGRTLLLDGDLLRKGLCADLGFSEADRHENMRRVGHVASLFLQQEFLVLAAFISPLEQDRQRVRQIVGPARMLEIYVKCSLEECERRDVKGLYRRARAGEIPSFTGISAPYEAPAQPDLVVDTEHSGIEACAGQVIHAIQARLAVCARPAPARQQLPVIPGI